MGACLKPKATQHPVLGSIEHVQLNNQPLLKVTIDQIQNLRFQEFEEKSKKYLQANSRIQEYLFLPVLLSRTPRCGLNTKAQFYFQNYNNCLSNQESKTDQHYSQSRIKEIGKYLFQFASISPELDQQITQENILFNQQGQIKIALRKCLLPQSQLVLNSNDFTPQKKSPLEETNYSNSELSPENSEFKRKHLLENICSIILSLIDDRVNYSPSFRAVIKELREIEKNQEFLYGYFLERNQRNPQNFFLDRGYIQNFNETSIQTSLFLVTETQYDFT